jgi:hypothetical protein
MNKLIMHINGSFILTSIIFTYIIQPATKEDFTTPMDHLPLALAINGLDGLYGQTLLHSQHLPRFRDIISTITLLEITYLLGIEAFRVVCVLLNLQAIIHVPGTDKTGDVTLCHMSLHDFLTTQSCLGPHGVAQEQTLLQ